MPRIEVEPGQLHSASGRQAALAERVTGLRGTLEGVAADASAAAGEAVAAAAIIDCGMAWSASLDMLAQSVGGLAANVGAAGTTYAATDASAMPGR